METCPECNADAKKIQGSDRFYKCTGDEKHHFELSDGVETEDSQDNYPTIALG